MVAADSVRGWGGQKVAVAWVGPIVIDKVNGQMVYNFADRLRTSLSHHRARSDRNEPAQIGE